jgi:hypothetical protein
MRPGAARVAVPFLLPLWEKEGHASSLPCPAPGAFRCVLRGSPSTSSGSHLRMREVGAILPHIETHLLFMKRISAGTPSLILRCDPELVEGEPRRTHLFIATPAFASGHCQRAGKDGRPKSRSSLYFLRSLDRPSRCLSRSWPVTTPAPCTFHGQDAAASPHPARSTLGPSATSFHLQLPARACGRRTPACVGPSGSWLPHQGGRSPPLSPIPVPEPGPARAMEGLCARCLGVGKDWR